MQQAIRYTILTVSIIFLLILVGFGVSAAANAKILIPVAFPFALLLIILLRVTERKPELLAWSVFTVWLGSTYLQTNSAVEGMALLFYLVLAVLGVFKSVYFLALAWLLHPVWDFLPRELPAELVDLPMACILFDVPIGLYLFWGSWTKRWHVLGEITGEGWLKNSLKTFYVIGLIVLFSYGVITIAQTGSLVGWAIPLAIAVIAALYFLGAKSELLAWAVLTGWVGMTYAHTGGTSEAVMFFVFVTISALAVFYSPYFLVLAWLLFIPWNFVSHPLPSTLIDLPVACAMFSSLIFLYLLWRSLHKGWH